MAPPSPLTAVSEQRPAAAHQHPGRGDSESAVVSEQRPVAAHQHPGSGDSESAFRTMLLSFLAGGVAGSLGKTLVAPLDRIKILFQISHMQFSFRSVGSELVRTYTKEGFAALFRGNWAQVLRVYPYSGVQLMAFDEFSKLALRLRKDHPAVVDDLQRRRPGEAKQYLTSVERLLAGAGAGCVSVLLTYPLDVMRARLAVQRELDASLPLPPGAHPAAADAGAAAAPTRAAPRGVFRSIYVTARDYGPSSLFRGITPTMMGILPYAAISFTVFEQAKQLVRERSGGQDPSPPVRGLCGGLAGLLGQGATYPLDVARRRMQTEGFSAIHAHRTSAAAADAAAAPGAGGASIGHFPVRAQHGLVATVAFIVREEGVRGLFKGFSLNVVKGPVATGVSFAVYDALKKALGMARAPGVE